MTTSASSSCQIGMPKEEKESNQKVLCTVCDDDGAQISEAQSEDGVHESEHADEDCASDTFIEMKAPEEERRYCDREDRGESLRCAGHVKEREGLAKQVPAKDVLLAEACRKADTRPQQKLEPCRRRDRFHRLILQMKTGHDLLMEVCGVCWIGMSQDQDEHNGHNDEAERRQAPGIDRHTAHDFEEPWTSVMQQRIPEEETAVVHPSDDAAEQHPDH